MGKINLGGVILGGLVAGVVINVGEFLLNAVVMAEKFTARMTELGLSEGGTGTMVAWIVYGFVLGIASVWLYAAIRPRFGAGVKTAMCAGALVWFFAFLGPSFGMINMGIFSFNLSIIGIVWGLIEMPIAVTAGAWLYKEG